MYLISTDDLFKNTLVSNIISEKNIVTEQEMHLKKLKRHAQAQAKLESKKAKKLEEGIVEKYDEPKRPSAAMIHPDFWNKIHTSVKTAQTLAEVFVDNAIIISQDNKAKVGLGVPAVGRTFKTIQTFNEPISVANHDFPVDSKMKLIPSVYLVIDLANLNDSFRLDQLAIFVRFEYFVGTTSLTYISNPERQSAYNPVKRSMASLSEKLAGIMLPINEFESHLDSQGKVLNEDLACKNFEFAEKSLYNIWKRDNIYSRSVITEYVDQIKQPFTEIGSLLWE
ncbi:44741_t:CDS:2 [Gigaspora margarita]|uniref:44741_t:CDS:1 n=1 Tax=Gigaspora margarita TaxID=4874 RepID=A0ABN7VUF7_GIGMA|nr:44741_t:CDS:2 [Gigaspora margarita]